MTARRILVSLAVWLLSASLLHGADRPNIVVILADDTPATPDRDTDHAHPRDCGFERQCVFRQPHLRTYGKPIAGEYTPDVLQAWALKFITELAAKEQPFFLYYASPLPHFPYWPTPLNPDGRDARRHEQPSVPHQNWMPWESGAIRSCCSPATTARRSGCTRAWLMAARSRGARAR